MPKGNQGDSRSRATQNRLKMYDTKAKRDKKGKVLYEAFKSRDESHIARIQPDRRWFGSTRTVDQDELSKFREEMGKQKSNPASYILKPGKIPFSLLKDVKESKKPSILGVHHFAQTFGKKATRKRPQLEFSDMDELKSRTTDLEEKYEPSKDRNVPEERDWRPMVRDRVFSKGQSARIWGELHKVLDSSDVVVEVLDARDPLGTRAYHVEKHLKKNAPHKHVLLLLNKADLVPTWALKRWLSILSKEYPVIAFHASITKPFGKGSLIQILRQFQHLHADKQQISVGFIGYPNVGKSSVINTLRRKKVCPAAPVPGYTKVWQYITLFKKIFLVDCPGVVYASDDTESDIVLKGVVRVESLEDAVEHIPQVLQRCRKQHIINTYSIFKWNDHIDFLTQLARKLGRVLPGNEPDLNSTAKLVLHDWLKGRIPFFVPPPFEDGTTEPRERSKQEHEDGKEINGSESSKKDSSSSSTITVLNPPPQILNNLNVRQEYAEQKGPHDDVDKDIVQKDDDVISDDEDEDDSNDNDSDHGSDVHEMIDWDEVYGEADGSEDDDELVPITSNSKSSSISIQKKQKNMMDEKTVNGGRKMKEKLSTNREDEDDDNGGSSFDNNNDGEMDAEDEEDPDEDHPSEDHKMDVENGSSNVTTGGGLTTIQMTKSILKQGKSNKNHNNKKRKRDTVEDSEQQLIEDGFGHYKRTGMRKPKNSGGRERLSSSKRPNDRGSNSKKSSSFEEVPEGYRPSKMRKMK